MFVESVSDDKVVIALISKRKICLFANAKGHTTIAAENDPNCSHYQDVNLQPAGKKVRSYIQITVNSVIDFTVA